jgi:hypothetical protein
MNGTAFAVCAMALAAPVDALAQNVFTTTVGTITTPVPGSTMWAVPIGGTTTANVSTTDLISAPLALHSIWIAQAGLAGTENITIGAGRIVSGVDAVLVTATNDTINIANNGALKATIDGIFASNITAGDITVTGPGTINAANNGMWLVTPGAVNVGTTAAPIGAVTGGLNGIVVTDATGPVNISATSVTGTAGYGIWTVGGTGIQTISTTGAVTGALSGEFLNSTTGSISTTATGAVTGKGASGIFATSTSGAIIADGKGTGTLTGGVLDGATITTLGNATVNNFATVTGLRNGIYVNGTAGTTNINNNGLVGGITGTTLNGIVVGPSSGNVNIGTAGTNGSITAAANGIWINNTLAGNNAIVQNNNVTGGDGFYGVLTGTATGATSITATAATKGGTGIGAISTTGAITLDGKGTGTLKGTTVDGATVTTQGNATVQNFATVDGLRNGIYVLGSAGTTSVQGNGLTGGVTGTTNNGIVVGPSTGDVNIGTVATNGVVTGGVNGIWVNNLAAGNTAIVTDKNVTGSTSGGWGILSTTVNGNNAVNVNAGTIRGNAALEATTVGSGNVATTIAAGAIVDGTTWGYVTTTGTGVGVTNNAGLIKTTADTGAAGTAGSGLAVLVKGGVDNTINNNAAGQIIGGFTTGGINMTMNNNTGAIWTPSLANSFGATNDAVNNTGLINIRTGNTVFAGLENLSNKAAGVVDLTYGGTQATNSLTVGGSFNPLAGSTIKETFNPTLANNAGLGTDTSSSGKGTADTILASKIAPGAKSTIELTTVGSVAALTGTSGSVALVQGTAILGDPGLGGSAKFVPSAFYTLVGNPSTGAVKFNLTDAPDGGVFLQWAPNVTAATLGGFGGALGARSAGGAGAAGGGAGTGSALAGGAAGSSGVGGVGFGGGPSGGGALGQVGDMAAASALGSGGAVQVAPGQGSIKDSPQPTAATHCNQKRFQAWGQAEAETTSTRGGFGGGTESLSAGVDADIGDRCGRFGVGLFSMAGKSHNSTDTSTSNGSNTGLGGYIRATSGMGLYGTLLAATSWSDTKLGNAVLNSTAEKHGNALTAAATVGYIAKLSTVTALDLRSFASRNTDKSGGFTDSVGITVSDTRDIVRTYGISLGLHQALTPGLQGYVRAGLKRSDLDSSMTAFNTTLSGSVGGIAKSLEAGVTGSLGNGVSLGASTFGTFSQGATGYGGRATLGVRF